MRSPSAAPAGSFPSPPPPGPQASELAGAAPGARRGSSPPRGGHSPPGQGRTPVTILLSGATPKRFAKDGMIYAIKLRHKTEGEEREKQKSFDWFLVPLLSVLAYSLITRTAIYICPEMKVSRRTSPLPPEESPRFPFAQPSQPPAPAAPRVPPSEPTPHSHPRSPVLPI